MGRRAREADFGAQWVVGFLRSGSRSATHRVMLVLPIGQSNLALRHWLGVSPTRAGNSLQSTGYFSQYSQALDAHGG